ncbi:MAG TPA: hypothetical protein DCO77_04835 [Nitrospiraceae bacterium]|nr:hypothetical protein [Nitrospiraceae bacterium]
MANKKLYTIILLAGFTLFASTGCSRTPEQRADRIVEHMAKKLELNDTQKARLDKIKGEFIVKRQELITSRGGTFEEANALMRSETIDQARLNALVDKNKEQAADMVQFVFAKFNEIHDILTPEQREKLVSKIEKYKGKGRYHH